MFVCLFRMAGQTAGPIETKLDTRTRVHPGSVSGKVNVKVIHVYRSTKHPERCTKATSGERCLNYVRTTAEATPSERLRNSVRTTVITAPVTRRAPSSERVELRPEDGYLQLVMIIFWPLPTISSCMAHNRELIRMECLVSSGHQPPHIDAA